MLKAFPLVSPQLSQKVPKPQILGARSKSCARGASRPQLGNAQTYGVTEANPVFLWLTDIPMVAIIWGNLRKRGIEGVFLVLPNTPITRAFSTPELLAFGAGHFFAEEQEGSRS